MRMLSPTSISRLYVPSECDLRTWLRTQGEVEEARTVRSRCSSRNRGSGTRERSLVDWCEEQPDWIDIDGYANPDALEETRAAIEEGRGFIYQGQLGSRPTRSTANPSA